MNDAPRLDVVAFGATSFVGRLLCRYLLERHGARGGEIAWGIAGRSAARLEALRRELGAAAADLPLLVADAADEPALRALCGRARVVVSTVGPYALHGEPLVRACVQSGTDYADLTGEVQWIRRMIERYEHGARRSGARIVHACGFDSIPSDLGVHFVQQESLRRYGVPCNEIAMRVQVLRGAASGGTVASMVNIVREAAADPALRRTLADPYALCGPDADRLARQPRDSDTLYDAEYGAWAAPFVMAAVNTRIVHRTNWLKDYAYGRDFRYGEAVLTGRGPRGRLRAAGVSAGLAAFAAAAAFGPTRRTLERFVLPAPGEGPSPEAQRRGRFDLRFIGRVDPLRRVSARVTGDRDPGYGSTAKMLGEAAACLARDVPAGERGGGFWTPATMLGDRLVARLRAHAGVAFDLLDR
jgi:short subunit dehydrogenase-like uncharacterized protein